MCEAKVKKGILVSAQLKKLLGDHDFSKN